MEGTNKGYFAFGSIHIHLHPCIFLNEILLTLEQTKKKDVWVCAWWNWMYDDVWRQLYLNVK